jgi:hypothetical protein
MYNPSLVAAVVLIAALEIGLASGFGSVFAVQGMKEKTKSLQQS